jgi:DNA-binding NarL/FixJ family response regulator
MPIRTIIADDAKMMRDRCKVVCRGISALEIIGEYEDGVDALAAARELKPDLLLTDVQMLQMTGLEVARILKAENSETKVVLCTSMGQAAAGGQEFQRMIKPFHTEQLRATLYQLFGDQVLEK